MEKKILRLTESDLMRIVKRVIREQQTPNIGNSTGVAQKAANMFCAALGKDADDEEDQALAAVKMLKTAKDVYEFALLVQQKERMSLPEFFNKYMSEADPEYPQIVQHIGDITAKSGGPYLSLGDNNSMNQFLRVVRQSLQGKRE